MLQPEPIGRDQLRAVLTDLVRQWCDRRVESRRFDTERTIPAEVREDLGAMGLTGLTLPADLGGTGLGLGAACHVVAALAQRDRSVATTLGLHLGLGTRGLVAYGDPRLQEEVLRPMASGERLGAFCATEPGAGSDLSRLRTRVEAIGDGSGDWRVTGEKIFVTNGAWAGCYTVVGERIGVDGQPRGRALVVVLPEDGGVRVGREEHKLGLRGSSTTPVHFDAVRIPGWRLLGEPQNGSAQLAHVLSWGRTMLAAGCVGAADAAWQAARSATATRVQFGATLDRNDVVREQLVDADALRLAMRATVSRAADDPAALADRSLAAKVLCSEGAWELADLAVQLHGGSGFCEETGVPLLLRDTRVPRIFEGANDVLLQHVAVRALVAPPRAPTGDTDPLGEAADRFAEIVAEAVDDARRRHGGMRLLREPRTLHRLGRLLVLRESVDAVAAEARDATPLDRTLALHWVSVAHRRALPWLAPADPLPPLRDLEAP